MRQCENQARSAYIGGAAEFSRYVLLTFQAMQAPSRRATRMNRLSGRIIKFECASPIQWRLVVVSARPAMRLRNANSRSTSGILRAPGLLSHRRKSKALCRQGHLRSLRFWSLRLALGEPVSHTLESMNDSALLQKVFATAHCLRGPNPSIEGTSTMQLRCIAAAPHVKR